MKKGLKELFGAVMDVIAETAKTSIKADCTQNYLDNSDSTASVYTSMSAVSTASRKDRSIQFMELMDETQEEVTPNAVEDALYKLKAAVRGMKEAADEMADEFNGLINSANANGGKIPNVNEILQNVLSEKNKEDDGL